VTDDWKGLIVFFLIMSPMFIVGWEALRVVARRLTAGGEPSQHSS
jgi:hypothetical protein